MSTKNNSLAGLLLAILLMAGAWLAGVHSVWLISFLMAPLVFGAVTVTFADPVQGTTPPTVIQMKPLSLLTGTVNWADADTQALITHNFNLTTIPLPTNNSSLVTETSCLFPLASWYYTAGGSNTSIVSGSIQSSAVFALLKSSAASMGGTLNFFLLRPDTKIR